MLLVILRLVDRMCGKLLDLANVLIFFFLILSRVYFSISFLCLRPFGFLKLLEMFNICSLRWDSSYARAGK